MEKTVHLTVTFTARSKTEEQVDEALEALYQHLDAFEKGWDGEAQVELYWRAK